MDKVFAEGLASAGQPQTGAGVSTVRPGWPHLCVTFECETAHEVFLPHGILDAFNNKQCNACEEGHEMVRMQHDQ